MTRDANNRERAVDAPAAAARHRADEDAVTATEAIPDAHQADRHAAENVADRRARNATQLQVVKGLSLAALGRRLGMSKAHANQLVKRATTAGGRR